jgi:hypothetical protein
VATLRNWVDRETRMYTVAAPLLINNAALCKRNARNLAGFTAKTKYSYSADFIDAAQAAFGLDERLQVRNVMPGSGAAQSGLQPGDVLLALQDKALPQGPNAERDAAVLFASAMQGRNMLNLAVLRQGQRLPLAIPLTRACAFAIELGDAGFINSYADGERVMITRGMLDFVQSDEELAYVLAKEIAHAALIQTPRPAMAAAIDNLMAFTPGSIGKPEKSQPAIKPYSPVLDSTADKLSLYMLARAGYSIDNALGFWKRLAASSAPTDPNSHTALHPASAYRFSVISAVVPAIKAKQANRMPLVP